MDLVNDHKPQVSKEPGDGGVFVQEHGFQGFRGDLQNAGGVLHELFLVAPGNVPVPVPHRDPRLVAQLVQSEKLVVDEGLQGADIDTADGGGHVLGKQGDDGEKGGLGFPRRGGGGEQDVVVGVKNGIRRGHLDGPEVFPVVPVDILLDKGGIAVKSSHRLPPLQLKFREFRFGSGGKHIVFGKGEAVGA